MIDVKLLSSPHPFAANCYLIGCCGEYAVIDPTAPYNAELCDGRARYVLLTHAHFDHILEVDSWVREGRCQVMISSEEAEALSDPMRNCYKLYDGSDGGYFGEVTALSDGETIPLGDREIKIMHCPGHTIGSAAYLIDGYAFVGDTVFEGGGFGRYDLPTGSLVMLKDSIRKIASLPDDTKLYPGHGDPTTVRQYKKDMIFRG